MLNAWLILVLTLLRSRERTKSHYYVSRTAQVYRQAIDDAVAGRDFDEGLFGALQGLANRGYTDGFYQRHHTKDHQNYLENASRLNEQQFVAEITHYDAATGKATVTAKNKFTIGDRLQLITPQGNHDFILEDMHDLNGQVLESALGSGYEANITIPAEADAKGLIARYLD